MNLKTILLLSLVSLLSTSCNKEKIKLRTDVPVICGEVACETSKPFFAKALFNRECNIFGGAYFRKESTELSMSFGNGFVPHISEGLSIRIYDNTDLKDTIWLGFNSPYERIPGIAWATYHYINLDAYYGDFRFDREDSLTYEDYLLIDYFNEDTTIIEGRFQVRFPRRNVANLAHVPDTMRWDCGEFRIEEL